MNNFEKSSLPKWDLSDLFKGVDDPLIEETYNHIEKTIDSFVEKYKEDFINHNITPQKLFDAISDYELIEEHFYKILSFAFLGFAANSNDEKIVAFYQNAQEKCNILSTKLIFMTLIINKITDEALEKCYENCEALKDYKPWIDGHRLFKKYQLSEDLERLIHEKATTSSYAWERLYEESLNDIKIKDGEKTLTLSDILNNISSNDEKIREKSANQLSSSLKDKMPILSLAMNTILKDKEITDSWRKYPNPTTPRHLSNQVEEEVVEALANCVKQNYSNLSHRYYSLKAKWMGKEKIEYWDRNAPLSSDEKIYSWEDAKKIVFNSYYNFSPTLAQLVQKFFDNDWIDAEPRPGKDSGAFSHPTYIRAHPYILMNYYGKRRDIMTLAHEIGHGAHQILSNDQPQLLCDTPLTVAETASVFGEMLTFKELIKESGSNEEKKLLIAAKVEDMLNTVVRQIAFYEFEKEIHNERKLGEISTKKFEDIWMKTQKEALGDSVNLDEIIRPYWSYVTHFVRSPFYVYAYAFGDCLVNSLYGLYEKGHEDFEEKYLELLRAGGSKRYDELLKPFGLDAKDPSFWQNGLDVIANLIDDLESLN